MGKKTTKITFESEYGKHTVEVRERDMDLQQVYERLIEPMLLAVGYSDKTIDDVFWPKNN